MKTSVTIKSRALAGGRVRWMLYFRPTPPDGKALVVLDYERPEDRPIVEALARAARAAMADAPKRESSDEWYDRFVRSRMGRVSTAAADHAQWLKWISKAPVRGGTFGSRPIEDVSPDDVEAVRDALDAAVDAWEAAGKKRGVGLAFATAANVWAILTLAMRHASTRKGDRAFRVRDSNPCDGVRPPRRGASKRRHWLRPSEVSSVLATAPRPWAEAIAIGTYLHLRPGELQELRARDVDLEAGEVSIVRAWSAGVVKAPKTEEGIRTITIPPALRPLLVELCDGADPDRLLAPVVGQTSDHDRPEIFRALLRAAGARAELFVDSPTHEAVDFRSIRDTGITWRFLAGDRAEHVQREAGHRELGTTLGYAKEVENRGGRFGEPFPALPFHYPSGLPKTETQTDNGSCEPSVNRESKVPETKGKLVARVGFESKGKFTISRPYERPCEPPIGAVSGEDEAVRMRSLVAAARDLLRAGLVDEAIAALEAGTVKEEGSQRANAGTLRGAEAKPGVYFTARPR